MGRAQFQTLVPVFTAVAMDAPEKGGTREAMSLVYSVRRDCGLVICAFMDIRSK